MNSRSYFLSSLLVICVFLSFSCAQTQQSEKIGDLASKVPATPERVSNQESAVATDEATGALSSEGKTETEKEIEQIKSELESRKSTQELQRRQQEEEQRKVQRAITEDIIAREAR